MDLIANDVLELTLQKKVEAFVQVVYKINNVGAWKECLPLSSRLIWCFILFIVIDRYAHACVWISLTSRKSTHGTTSIKEVSRMS